MLVEWQLPSGAKSPVFLVANMYGLKPVPFTKFSFSAASEVRGWHPAALLRAETP